MKSLYTSVAITLACLMSNVCHSDIYISEVDLQNNIVEIVNDGMGPVDITAWWICNRVNGSPFYQTLAGGSSINGASTEATGAADYILEDGDVLVLDITPGMLPDANGEFSFYNTNSFGSSAAIEDYIAWGGPGIRDNVAAGAGIWTIGDFIDVSGLAAGESIQLQGGATGVSSGEYFFGQPTLGARIPEPSAFFLLGLGFAAVAARRKR